MKLGSKRVADIVIMGAGLGGAIMAYEMKEQMRREDKLTVVTKDPIYHFVPSIPWVLVGWRTRQALEVDLARLSRSRPSPKAKVSASVAPLSLCAPMCRISTKPNSSKW